MSEAEKIFDPRPVFNALGMIQENEDYADLTGSSDAELKSVAMALAEDDGSKPETHFHYLQQIRQEQKLRSKLISAACTDPLTGLYNRRFFMAALGREIAEIQRGISAGSSLIMIDLDHFKPINDNLGHEAGDKALLAVAKKVGENLRKSDVLGRLGGDEFAVLATGVEDTKSELSASERVAALFPVEFEHDGKMHSIFASVGACPVKKGESVQSVLRAADAEMYKIKENSRSSGAPRHDGGMR